MAMGRVHRNLFGRKIPSNRQGRSVADGWVVAKHRVIPSNSEHVIKYYLCSLTISSMVIIVWGLELGLDIDLVESRFGWIVVHLCHLIVVLSPISVFLELIFP